MAGRLEDVLEYIKEAIMSNYSDCTVMISDIRDELRIFCLGDQREIVAKILDDEDDDCEMTGECLEDSY